MHLAAVRPAEVRWLRALLALTLVLLVAGLVTPIVTLRQFLLVENSFSIVGGIAELGWQGHLALAMLIGVFSVLLPLLKLALIARLLGGPLASSERLRRGLHWIHSYGRWSMLDVFVVAVLVVAVKLGAIASVEPRLGLYAFGAAVLLTMLLTARVVALAEAALARGAERLPQA